MEPLHRRRQDQPELDRVTAPASAPAPAPRSLPAHVRVGLMLEGSLPIAVVEPSAPSAPSPPARGPLAGLRLRRRRGRS